MVDAALVWDDVLAGYRFRPGHPMDPRRLELTVSLIRRLGMVGDAACPVVAPRPATDAELLLVHSPEYVAAVKRLSEPGADAAEGARWGLGDDDTPIVPGMHERAAAIAGATLTAAEWVMEGRAKRAFVPSGGLHHAHRERASGFCIYNDLAVAIEWMRRDCGARVLYIDVDAHHGDGVQSIFYDDPDVATLSFHESGFYLFPATGYVDEMGDGDGYGYAVNVPLEAETGDASWRDVFFDLAPAVVEAFRPDVIVYQSGCDGHVLDPLAHLRATTGLYEAFAERVRELADEHCEGRLVATGGGGYAVYTVVPRAWTLVWGALSGRPAPERVPEDWREAVREESGEAVPELLRDPPDAYPPSAREAEIRANNARTVQDVKRRVLPLLTGWGLAF